MADQSESESSVVSVADGALIQRAQMDRVKRKVVEIRARLAEMIGAEMPDGQQLEVLREIQQNAEDAHDRAAEVYNQATIAAREMRQARKQLVEHEALLAKGDGILHKMLTIKQFSVPARLAWRVVVRTEGVVARLLTVEAEDKVWVERLCAQLAGEDLGVAQREKGDLQQRCAVLEEENRRLKDELATDVQVVRGTPVDNGAFDRVVHEREGLKVEKARWEKQRDALKDESRGFQEALRQSEANLHSTQQLLALATTGKVAAEETVASLKIRDASNMEQLYKLQSERDLAISDCQRSEERREQTGVQLANLRRFVDKSISSDAHLHAENIPGERLLALRRFLNLVVTSDAGPVFSDSNDHDEGESLSY